MPVTTHAGVLVETDDEGYLRAPEQWTAAMAPDIARGEGIPELTEGQWQIVKLVRAQYEERGEGPSVQALSKASGVPIKELYRLFPKGPTKVAAKIAGIPKPRGRI